MDMIVNFFQSIPYFIILIGLLVFIHEAGHFLFAKLFKVKVHVFSLGFGPKLFGFQKGETLYKVSALPLGGYVKMLGEDPSETVLEEDKGRAFSDKPAWQRTLIIVGGPIMNIIFPLFLHFGAGLTMTEVMPAEVGFVLENMPAWKAGLRPGDIIESVDGKPIATFDDLVESISPKPGQKIDLSIRRGGELVTLAMVPKRTDVTIILDEKETVGRIGVAPEYLSTLIGVSDSESPAFKAGLKSFDLITEVNGSPVRRFVDLEKNILEQTGKAVLLKLKRFKPEGEPPFRPFENQFEKSATTVMLQVPAGITSIADIGIDTSTDYVAYVTKEGVAEAIGLKKGDKIVAINGTAAGLSQAFSIFNQRPDDTHMLAWIRNGKRFEASLKQKFIPAGEAGELGIKRNTYDKGFWGWIGQTVPPESIANPALVSSAFHHAINETWSGIRLIGIGFKALFQGKVSMRSIGGPIMIGQLAGQAGQMGAQSFFWIMALISLNLGLLNLLPIPVLDGGQLLLIAVESATRRPISQAIKEKVMLVGVAMILILMVFATWNDIARLVLG